MRVLAFDISSHCGWSLIEGDVERQTLVVFGKIEALFNRELPWPACHFQAASELARQMMALVRSYQPDCVVTEQVNIGRDRYAQILLGYIHTLFLELMEQAGLQLEYVNSSEWRKTLDLRLDNEQKKNNKRVKLARQMVESTPGLSLAEAKKKLGVKGSVGKKHLAVNWANETYGLDFKMKDNDIADAIGVGTARLKGALLCDGINR